MITGETSFVGVLGHPVAHTLSPAIHNHWLERHGIDAVYLPLPVHPDQLALAVRGLAACGCRGANVTVPHKQAALALCDRVAPSARAAGAVNTLVFAPHGQIIGHNTDGDGFMASLAAAGADPGAGKTLVLGAGGAARAIVASLLAAGGAVQIAARRPEQASELARSLPGAESVPWPDGAALAGYRLLVNASAGGMHGQAPMPAFDLAAAGSALVVADIVYAPRETALLQAARQRGLVRIGGIEMLLHQAALAFATWFGLSPSVDAAVRKLVAASV